MTTLHPLSVVANAWGRSELWITRQLRAGRFPGHKVGAQWRMSDDDIAAAEQIMRQPARKFMSPAELAAPVKPAQGLSLTPAARRRMRRSA